MINDFKMFLLRGNLVDLAVAVVIGVAFAAVVNSLVEDLITPLIAAVAGEPDFSALQFTINESTFRYGNFINHVLTFVVIAAVVFFLVIRPVTRLIARYRSEPLPDPTTKQCSECLSEIPVAARRCAFCTSPVGADATAAG